MFEWLFEKKKKVEVKATNPEKKSEDKPWRHHTSAYHDAPEFENECDCECDDHDCFVDEDCDECDCHDNEW